ncbi:MAG: PD-(D/E)XK nuclease family protein [Bradymonadales bacterium]|nr:PD-(D/E)XK nuclease family protein [Bradymonadales bacterium]
MAEDATLVILPVFDRVEQALREKAAMDRGWTGTNRHLTLAGLIDRLFRHTLESPNTKAWWDGYRSASATEIALLRRRLVKEAQEGLSDRLATLLTAPGFSRLLSGFFEECGEGLVTPEELGRFAAEVAPDNERLVLLARLWKGYRERLRQARLLDPTDRVQVARDLLALPGAPLPDWLQGVQRVEVRDQVFWSPLRLSLLLALAIRLRAELGPPDRLRMVIPYSHEGYRLFHYLEPTLRELEQQSDLPVELVFSPIEEEESGPPGRIAAALFGDRSCPAEDREAISLASAPGKRQELRAVARRIRRLLDQGVPPDDIAVGLRHPQSQWLAVSQALDAYRIPWHYRRGETLDRTPLVRHLVEVLNAASASLPRESLERILTSFFCEPPPSDRPLPTTGAASGSFTRRALSILRQCGARDLRTGAQDGKNGYQMRIEAFLTRHKAKARRTLQSPTRPNGGADGPQEDRDHPIEQDGPGDQVESDRRGDRSERDQQGIQTGQQEGKDWYGRHASLDQLDRDVREILRRVAVIEQCREPRRLEEWTTTLPRISGSGLLTMHPTLETRMLHDLDGEHPQEAIRSIQAFALNQRSVTALDALLEEMSWAGRDDQEQLTAGQFSSLLLEVAGEISLFPLGCRGGAVRILPVRHLAGARFAHLFVPHLNEGLFPQPPRADPLLRDPERSAFNRWRRACSPGRPVFRAFRIEEPQAADERVPVRRSEEVVLFCLAMACAAERCWISWSTRDDQDRPLLPSLFVDGLRRILGRSPFPLEETSSRTQETGGTLPPSDLVPADQELGWRASLSAGEPRCRPDRFSTPPPEMAVEEHEPVETVPTISRMETLEEAGQRALLAAKVGLTSSSSPAWLEVAQQALGSHRLSSILCRARGELGRSLFFARVLADRLLRQRPPADLPAPLAPYLGYLSDRSVIRWLAERRFHFRPEAPASASRLELYGQCPARFFFSEVLRLRPEEDAEEEMALPSRGRLVHLALERFYALLADQGYTSLAVLGGPERPQVLVLVERAVDDAIGLLEPELHLGHPQVLAMDRRHLIDTILQALDRAIDPRARSAQLPLGFPIFQEWSFGMGGAPPVQIELEEGLGTLCLSGRIDRIDREPDSSLVITDYKLSRQASQKVKLTGPRLHRRDFQLSIYAAAALSGLPPPSAPFSSLAVQYYCLLDGKSARLEGQPLLDLLGIPTGGQRRSSASDPVHHSPTTDDAPAEDRRGMDSLANAATDQPRRSASGAAIPPPPSDATHLEEPADTPTLAQGLTQVVRGIQHGLFPAATRGCEYCELGELCRVTERVRQDAEP